jgi:hypothetical protein
MTAPTEERYAEASGGSKSLSLSLKRQDTDVLKSESTSG